jgi:hypothetical protein
MAGADYFHCTVCGGKVFFDAKIDWTETYAAQDDAYMHGVSVVALCETCNQTHKIVVVERQEGENENRKYKGDAQ